MTDGHEIESVLAIDEGTITTKAVLVDRVDGVYRFIARGEAPNALAAPERDGLVGFQGALQQVEEITGRMLRQEQAEQPFRAGLPAGGDDLPTPLMPEQPDGHGVDALVASTSLFPPLRVVIAGMISDLSVESARRAVKGTYATIEDTISLNEGGKRWGETRGIEAKLENLCQNPPDAILLVGGVDGGAVSPLTEVSEMLVAVASVVEPSRRPTVIFAGNPEARSAVAEMLADRYEFRAVDNVRPQLQVEILTGVQDELERLYRERGLRRLPGLRVLPDLSAVPLMSAAKAFELVIRFMARHYGLTHGVLGVDLGGANTQVVAVLGEQSYGLVRSNRGSSLGLEDLVAELDIQALQRWLPFAMSPEQAHNQIMNKAIYPLSVPQSREDLLLEQAIAREDLRLALSEMSPQWQGRSQAGADGRLPPLDLIVGSGGVLSHAPNSGQAAMILLDALQPVGLCRLVQDRLGILAALGAMAPLQPLATAQVLEQDGFLELGTVVAPLGITKMGDIALRLKVTYADESVINVEVPYGSLEVIPLPIGQTAVVELYPTRRFDIGWGQRGRSGKINAKGGAVGIIVDARGRPMTFAEDAPSQQQRVQEWLWSVGG